MESLDKIGEVVPQINGFCSSTSPNKIMRYIQFKVVNPLFPFSFKRKPSVAPWGQVGGPNFLEASVYELCGAGR